MRSVKVIINSIIITLITTVLILFFLLFSNNVAGLSIYVINDDNMQPTYQKGSIVYVKEKSFEDIKVGDTITYIANSNLDIKSNRVIDKDIEQKLFKLQGDKSSIPKEKLVHDNNILGTIEYSIPHVGFIYTFIRSDMGLITLIISIFALTLAVFTKIIFTNKH